MERNDKHYTPAQAKEKIFRYCAYQERCHQEVKNKLYEYGLHKNDVEELLTELILEKFVNEERFAKAYAGGKFRMKQWGRNKITRALDARNVSSFCIKAGLREIDDEDYLRTLTTLLERKVLQVTDANAFKRREKVALYAIAKGYEPDLVWAMVKELIPIPK